MTSERFSALAAINKFFFYSMNYKCDTMEINGETKSVPTFFNAFPAYLRGHLLAKFNDCYDKYGCHGVMMGFYGELDGGNRRKLLDWILDNYSMSNSFGIDLSDD